MTTSKRQVDVLFFDDCPNVTLTVDRVRRAAELVGAAVDVRLVRVADAHAAAAERFLGSPSVRVDGRDLEEHPPDATFELRCRLYTHDGRIEGAPPLALIEEALREGVARGRTAGAAANDCCSRKERA